MDLARRSITSISWNTASDLISVIVLLLRSILLARLVAVETFGVYAGASAIISLATIPAIFGLDRAFIHRSEFTEDEGKAASVHFSLLSISAVVWTTCMCLGIVLFSSGPLRTALFVMTAMSSASLFCQTPLLDIGTAGYASPPGTGTGYQFGINDAHRRCLGLLGIPAVGAAFNQHRLNTDHGEHDVPMAPCVVSMFWVVERRRTLLPQVWQQNLDRFTPCRAAESW